MKSKSLIEKQLQKKSNPFLVETLIIAKKNSKWNEVASILSSPRRRKISLNLDEINKSAKAGENLLIPGKVLSEGEIEKKIRVIAFSFSEKAKEKLLRAKCEVSTILEEIKRNPEAKGFRILR